LHYLPIILLVAVIFTASEDDANNLRLVATTSTENAKPFMIVHISQILLSLQSAVALLVNALITSE